jgi:serine/threonine protein kinase
MVSSLENPGGPRQRTLERLGIPQDALEGSRTGEIIDGRWRLVSKIGYGAFGQVYEARDSLSGERVALKIFNDAFLNSGYLQELGLMFDESHPNIVKILSFGYTSGRKYITYEFVPGGTLRDFLVHERRVSPEVALELLGGVARGLAFAHDRNVVHRDLKPENILLTSPSLPLQVKLCDFGLSARFAEGERLNSSFGSPAYMAPEQFDGDYDWRVDYYALGVILYEMLFGRRPFTGDATSICYAQKNHDIALPERSVAGLNELLLKLLHKDPAERFQSADELLGALELCGERLYIESTGERIRPPARNQLTLRQRWLASLPQSPRAYGICPDGDLVFYASRRLISVDQEGQFMELLRPGERIESFATGRGLFAWRCGDRVQMLRDDTLSGFALDPSIDPAACKLEVSPDGEHLLALTPAFIYLYGSDGELRWRAEVETYGVIPPACFSANGQVVWVATEAPRTQLLAVSVEGAKLCRASCPGTDVALCGGPEGSVFVGLRGRGALHWVSVEGFIEREGQLIEGLHSLHRMGDTRVAAMSAGHIELFDTETLQSQAFIDLPSPSDLTFFSDEGIYQVGQRNGEVRIHYHALSR